MRRLHASTAYDTAIWPDSHWRATAPALHTEPLPGSRQAEALVIGAGYAGLSAALSLAEAGVDAVVLDAGQPGWGASGRNGGFCCMGGAKLSDADLVRRFGRDEARGFVDFQARAVAHVADALDRHGIDADRGPGGELCLAHSPRAWTSMKAEAEARRALTGQAPVLLPAESLAERGLTAAGTHGATLNPVGFPLHPMKYVLGLARAAQAAGVALHGDSPVTALSRTPEGWEATTPTGSVRAPRVLIATNGYSSEDLPPWIGGRTLPAFSTILVTRPLSQAERAAQGWTSEIMAFDSRTLLHYFRLLPCGRLLFGMRGGVSADPAAQAGIVRQAQRHLAAMFPAWAGVPVERAWSGLVCLTGSLTPFAGPVPGVEGLFVAFGWHGNGVSTASLAGAEVGRMMAGQAVPLPAPLASPPRRFPLPGLRLRWLALTYAILSLTEGEPRCTSRSS